MAVLPAKILLILPILFLACDSPDRREQEERLDDIADDEIDPDELELVGSELEDPESDEARRVQASTAATSTPDLPLDFASIREPQSNEGDGCGPCYGPPVCGECRPTGGTPPTYRECTCSGGCVYAEFCGGLAE